MRLWTKFAGAAAIALAGSEGAAAQGLVVDAGGARVHNQWGVEGTIGYRMGILGFAVTPSVGAFATRSGGDRYVEEPDPEGGTRCRDSRDGDIDHDLACENADLRLIGRLEATYAIPLVAEAGLGVRVTKGDTTPYATVAMPIFPMAKLKGNVGQDYIALGLRIGF
jgi:hypothetical protein